MNITTDDILKSLPWHTAPKNTLTDDVLPALAIFGAGMLVGASMGVLFAPKPGRELRSDIKDGATSVAGQISDRATELSNRIPNITERFASDTAEA